MSARVVLNVRIYHECEGKIEKYVRGITVWYLEACRAMTNGDLEGLIFLSYPHTNIMDSIFLLTTAFIYLFIIKLSFQKSLNTLRCNCT